MTSMFTLFIHDHHQKLKLEVNCRGPTFFSFIQFFSSHTHFLQYFIFFVNNCSRHTQYIQQLIKLRLTNTYNFFSSTNQLLVHSTDRVNKNIVISRLYQIKLKISCLLTTYLHYTIISFHIPILLYGWWWWSGG